GKASNPVNLIIRPSDQRTADFIEENLSKRLSSEELISFALEGQQIFLLNLEIPQPVKVEGETKKPDLRIGFDRELMKELKEQGFEIVLSPGNTSGSNTQYINEYSDLVKQFEINYVVFDGMEISGFPDDIDLMQQVITENHLTVGIIETAVQLGYLNQVGIDELIYDSGYPINRVYSTRNDEYLKEVNERYYRWVRAVIDRGIRIIYLVPFQNEKLYHSVNLEDTLDTVARFHQTMEEKGFNTNQPLSKLSAEMPGKFHRLAVSLSLLIGSLLYLGYLFRPHRKTVLPLLALGFLGCLALNLFTNADFTKLYALAAAILYPALSSLLALYYWRDNHQYSIGKQLAVSLAIILGVNAIGMYTIVTSLADITYIMNVEYFRGVKVAFLAPLLLFVFNYLVVYKGKNGIKKFLEDFLRTSPNYFILGLSLIGLVGLYLYLARSGHTAGVSVSSLELRTREVLETIFMARPRFKEIIIGYPALFALVYLYHKYKNEAIVLVLGLGVMMGSISMVNSFSHVFTAVTVSAQRTLAGLLVGVILGIITIIAVWVGEKIYRQWQ
ncbi:MAG: hypothetical protein GX808_02715, partial [Syntrophomonadaceae bacterium]|nr:hypothetical protein [Syntrophomonadaceae bacterium]